MIKPMLDLCKSQRGESHASEFLSGYIRLRRWRDSLPIPSGHRCWPTASAVAALQVFGFPRMGIENHQVERLGWVPVPTTSLLELRHRPSSGSKGPSG